MHPTYYSGSTKDLENSYFIKIIIIIIVFYSRIARYCCPVVLSFIWSWRWKFWSKLIKCRPTSKHYINCFKICFHHCNCINSNGWVCDLKLLADLADLSYISQQTLDVGPALVYYWPTAYDAGPIVNQRWAYVSCLLGICHLLTI